MNLDMKKLRIMEEVRYLDWLKRNANSPHLKSLADAATEKGRWGASAAGPRLQ